MPFYRNLRWTMQGVLIVVFTLAGVSCSRFAGLTGSGMPGKAEVLSDMQRANDYFMGAASRSRPAHCHESLPAQ